MVSLGEASGAAGLGAGPGFCVMHWKNRFWSCGGWPASFFLSPPPKPKPKGLEGSWGEPLVWELTSPNTGAAAAGRLAGERKPRWDFEP